VAMIIAATAHPAKFKDAILKATGKAPKIPHRLAQIYEREERFKVLPSNASAVKTEVYKLVESLR
ncbi:MAG: threonine synthase, partial [Rhodospirillales bacterium]